MFEYLVKRIATLAPTLVLVSMLIFAGSPGSSCCRPKISIDTSTSVGASVAMRLTRYSNTSILFAHGAIFRPVTRSSPSGTLRTPPSLAL